MKGKIPNQFKESIVTPVFKSGNKPLLTNYRPISVINNFSKLFEYCLKNILMDHQTHYKILSDNQFGFRKNISTENAIVQLTETIVNAININKKCLNSYPRFT